MAFLLSLLIMTQFVDELQTISTGIFASAGIFAAIIGFASQQAFSNIVGGIFIVIFKPFRVGDFIQVGTNIGNVEDITLRHTVIKDLQNKRIIIPNSVISTETIVNNHIEEKAKDTPQVVVRVIGIREYFITLMAYAWSDTPAKSFELGCDVTKELIKRYKEEGIEIPVPQRKIVQG